MLKELIHNKVFQNASWLVAGRVVQMLISMVVSLLTARYLGPANYGLINYAAAYTSFFSSLCTLGINSVLVKEFLDNPEKEGEIIGTSLGLRVLASAFSTMAIMAITCILDSHEAETQMVVALTSIGLVFHIFEVINYWFQSKLQSKKTAIAALIAYAVTALYRVVLLMTNSSVQYFAFASSVDYICIAVVLLWFYLRAKGGKFSFSWSYAKRLLSKSCHFILSGLMISIFAQTDKIMLKQMAGETEVGLYATAVALSTIWCFVLNAVIDSMVPPIMKAHNEDREKFERLTKMLYCIIFYICIFVSLVFTIGGEFILSLLYGEEYLPAALPLRVITWYTAFSYLGGARTSWVVCENKQKYLKTLYFYAAVCNVILNMFLIPHMGATGAAIASLITQILSTIVVPLFIKEMRDSSVLMLEAICLKGVWKRGPRKGP